MQLSLLRGSERVLWPQHCSGWLIVDRTINRYSALPDKTPAENIVKHLMVSEEAKATFTFCHY